MRVAAYTGEVLSVGERSALRDEGLYWPVTRFGVQSTCVKKNVCQHPRNDRPRRLRPFLSLPKTRQPHSRSTLTSPPPPSAPILYGLMTEEINYSYDGGLYAEMIRNRTFRSDWSGILNWFLVEKGDVLGEDRPSIKTTGPSTALAHSLNSRSPRPTRQSGRPPQRRLLGHRGASEHALYSGSFYAKSRRRMPRPRHGRLVGDNTGSVVANATVGRASPPTGSKYKLRAARPASVTPSSAEPLRITVEHARHRLAAARLPLPAHVPRPPQRQPRRHHGEAGRHASRLPAFSRRQLPRRRPHRGPLRLEEDYRPARRPPDAPEPLELPLLRRHGPARVPRVVRRPPHAAGARASMPATLSAEDS